MALTANAVITLEAAKAFLKLSPGDARFHVPGVYIYNSGGAGEVSASVQVLGSDLILIDDINGTTTLDLTASANETITDLVATINTTDNWFATAVTHGDAVSTDLIPTEQFDALSPNSARTLLIQANRDLELAIERVTDRLERWLRRGIVIRDYEEIIELRRHEQVREIVLKQPSVVTFEELFIDEDRAMTVSYSGSDDRAWVEVTDSAVVTRSQNATGTITETESTFASNTTIGAMVSTIDALLGWSASTVDDGPSEKLVREGARNASGVTVELLAWANFSDEYVVDYDAGVVDFGRLWWPMTLRWRGTEKRRMWAKYAAGLATSTSTVPDDIARWALRMVASDWHSQGRDDLILSRSLDSYSESFRSLNEISDSQPPWKIDLDILRRRLP